MGHKAKQIETKDASAPHGHYSQGVLCGEILFLSAQLPFRAIEDESSVPIDIQLERVLSSLLEITKAAGGNIGSFAKVNIYTNDIKHWDAINEEFARFMGSHKPARCIVEIQAIKGEWAVMADAVALIQAAAGA